MRKYSIIENGTSTIFTLRKTIELDSENAYFFTMESHPSESIIISKKHGIWSHHNNDKAYPYPDRVQQLGNQIDNQIRF